MVNGAFALIEVADPERRLALSYSPAEARAGLAALWALDEALGRILRTTQQPLVAQMRLAWWREALAALDDTPPPAEPVLQALAADVLPNGVRGAELAGQPDAWEHLLIEQMANDDFRAFGEKRGELFVLAARVLGGERPNLKEAGAAWALSDLARHAFDPKLEAQARVARIPYAFIGTSRIWWPKPLRALGSLLKVNGRSKLQATPTRVLRMAWHALTGF